MKKIFLLLLIACQVFLTPHLLQAACNQSTDPKVFKVHGTSKNRVMIEGDCLDELYKAIGEGKDIDIWYAETREAIFGYTKFAGGAIFGSAQFADDCFFNGAWFGVKSGYTKRYLTRENMQKITDEYQKMRLEENLDRYFLPKEEKIKAVPVSTTTLDYATFSKFADFRDALFLGDVKFEWAKFKEVGLFDEAFFFNAKTLGLEDKNNKNSLVDLARSFLFC